MRKCLMILLTVHIAQFSYSYDNTTSTMIQQIKLDEQPPNELEDHQENQASSMTEDLTEITETPLTWTMMTGENNQSKLGESKIRRDINGQYDDNVDDQPDKSEDVEDVDESETSPTSYEESANNKSENGTIETYDEYTTQKKTEPNDVMKSYTEWPIVAEAAVASAGDILTSTHMLYLLYICFGAHVVFV